MLLRHVSGYAAAASDYYIDYYRAYGGKILREMAADISYCFTPPRFPPSRAIVKTRCRFTT